MGISADRRLSERTPAPSDDFMREADHYAQEEKMPLGQAVEILSGQSRKPYGTPKPREKTLKCTSSRTSQRM